MCFFSVTTLRKSIFFVKLRKGLGLRVDSIEFNILLEDKHYVHASTVENTHLFHSDA